MTLQTIPIGGTTCAARIESSTPYAYRLKRAVNGELVLQGCFEWWQAHTHGFEWRDIPTIEE